MGIGNASVRAIDASVMPGFASTGLSTHLVKLGPCSSLAPHYHPTADEMQTVLEGEWPAAWLKALAGVCTCSHNSPRSSNTTRLTAAHCAPPIARHPAVCHHRH